MYFQDELLSKENAANPLNGFRIDELGQSRARRLRNGLPQFTKRSCATASSNSPRSRRTGMLD